MVCIRYVCRPLVKMVTDVAAQVFTYPDADLSSVCLFFRHGVQLTHGSVSIVR